MKYLLSILVAFVCVMPISMVNAQGLEVNYRSSISGNIGEELTTQVSIQNTSTTAVSLHIYFNRLTIGTSQDFRVCWKGECYDNSYESIPFPIRLQPGETTTDLVLQLKTGITEGISNASIVLVDKSKRLEDEPIEIQYTIEDRNTVKEVFNSSQVDITDVYPNPVREFVFVDYKIKEIESEYKVMIHSVLGSIVEEQILQPLETQAKIKTDNLNPGVYFLSLYIDNEGVMTRKLIVQN